MNASDVTKAPEVNDSDARLIALFIFNAKAYLDDTPEGFMHLLTACQDESEPAERMSAIAALCGLVDAARALVAQADALANPEAETTGAESEATS